MDFMSEAEKAAAEGRHYCERGCHEDVADAYQRGMVAGARQVLASVEALTERAERHRYDLDPEAVAAIAREAVARIEGGAS